MAKNTQTKKKNTGNSSKKPTAESLAKTSTELARRELSPLTGTPFTFMRRFSEEMDRLFEDFGLGRGLLAPELERGLDTLGTLTTGTWAPQVEVVERGNELIIRADLPGMTKDDINVDIDDRSIIIRGERKSEREENEKGYYRSERSYGSFYRRVPLPNGVDAEEATADFRDGVLEITLPAPQKTEEKRRTLEIGEGTRAKAKAASQR